VTDTDRGRKQDQPPVVIIYLPERLLGKVSIETLRRKIRGDLTERHSTATEG
jgi:hypothetical protein